MTHMYQGLKALMYDNPDRYSDIRQTIYTYYESRMDIYNFQIQTGIAKTPLKAALLIPQVWGDTTGEGGGG